MAEIWDRVREQIARVDREHSMKTLGYEDWTEGGKTTEGLDWEFADQILAIRELAVVDREAKLPEWELSKMGSETENAIYRVAQKDMAGWVKEE